MHHGQLQLTIQQRKDKIQLMIDFMQEIHNVTKPKQSQQLKGISDEVKQAVTFLRDVGVLAVSK